MQIPKTSLYLKLVATGLIIFGLSFLIPPQSLERTAESINEISQVVQEELDFRDTGIESTAVFLYSSDYSSRFLIASNSNLSLPRQTITGDVVYEVALDHHIRNLCFVIETSTIPKDTGFYKLSFEGNNIGDKIFYLSCPLSNNNKVIGYISAVVKRRSYGVVENYIELKYLKSHIEETLEDIL